MNWKLRRAALVVLTLAVVLGCWLPWMDRSAEAGGHAGFQRSLAAFALARTLGSAISVAQGTQVSLQPGGIGMTFAPGQVLQPLNGLVDKFALVMLMASVAFGIQIFLLKFGSHVVVSALLTVAMLAWAALAWRGSAQVAARWMQPLLVALLLLRLAVPLTSLANEAVYRALMSTEYDTAAKAVSHS